MSQAVIPKYKLIMQYDINQATHEVYYQFVIGEFVPTLQGMGLYMLQVYHTAYGQYPVRQIEFVAENLETIHSAMDSEPFKRVNGKLQGFVSNYSQKIVHFRDAFQF